MGRRKGWRHTLKKFLSCDYGESKTRKEAKDPNKWSQVNNHDAPENGNALPVNPPPPPPLEAENEQNRQAYAGALSTAGTGEAAVAADEAVRLNRGLGSKTKEEMAANKIQTAFRGYKIARTSKRSRLQERDLSLQPKENTSRESIRDNSHESVLSKDRIEENLRVRLMQEVGTSRERALAYAHSRRGRQMPTGRQTESDEHSIKTTNRSVSTKGDNLDSFRQSSKSTDGVYKPISRPSPRKMNGSGSGQSSERCHRYYRSTDGSSIRDDESLYSCPPPPGVRHYMASTVSSRAKSRTPGGRFTGNAKKMSFSGTPTSAAVLRRHSGPPRIEV